MNPASSADSRVTLRARFRTATREAILEAAADLLASDGASQTRMEDIAARAGIAVGTLYNYFEDRKALVSALLATRTGSLLDELDAVVSAGRGKRVQAAAGAEPAAAFEAQLTTFVAALGQHFERNRFLFGVLHDEERQRGIDAKAAHRKNTVLEELLARAERLMEKGMRARVLRREDPALYAAMLVGMMRGVGQNALRQRREFDDASARAIVRVFMAGAAR